MRTGASSPRRPSWLARVGLVMSGCASPPRPEVRPPARLVVATRRSDARSPAPEVRAAPGLRHLATTRGEGAVATAARPGAVPPPVVDWFLVELPAAPVQAALQGLRSGAPEVPPGEAALGWDQVYARLLGAGQETRATLLGLAGDPLQDELEAIEPDVEIFPPGDWSGAPAELEANRPAAAPRAPAEGRIRSGPSAVWPSGPGVAWHLGEGYTQLAPAREAVRRDGPAAGPRVLVAHIDTGHAPFEQVTTPAGLAANRPLFANFWDVPRKGDYLPGDALDRLTGQWESLRRAGFLATPGHGAATLSVLAGGAVRLRQGEAERFAGELGGAPDADVFCVRVAPTVVHLDSTRLALAIDYAVHHQADVISLSHGGLPSHLLTGVINQAYLSGTAVFAAASDFYERPPLLGLLAPWAPRRTPSRTMWPAAYQRVMSVTGVTAAGRSYSRSPGGLSGWLPWRWGAWMLRGSFGPGPVMDHALAAYAPNVPFAHFRAAGDPLDLVDLDGGGTSAATPQAAAAAALWLRLHRDEGPLQDHWRSWEKVENVFQALAATAGPAAQEAAPHDRLGAGVLQALAALQVKATRAVLPREPAAVDVPEAFLTVLLSMWTMPDRLPERRRQLVWSSLALEVTQIAALDGRVGEALEALRSPGGRLAPPGQGAAHHPLVEALRQALRRSRHASAFLRRAL